MKRAYPLLGTWLTLRALTGCTGPFLPVEPFPSPEVVFDAFWSDFDAYYSFFGDKGVNWDSVYLVHRPRVSSTTPERELFSILVDMVEGFQDGHLSLQSPFREWSYDGWRTRSPHNYFPEAVRQRLQGGGMALAAGRMRVGLLGQQIGYIAIENFVGRGFDEALDRALETVRGSEALIVDVRFNGGGSDLNSDVVLGRFADRERVYAYVRYRNGPRHDDFTPPRARTMKPAGRVRFTGPVAVLTNRGAFSTAEAFVLAMKVLPDATIVGDTTGGGTGNPYWRELPNGWNFRLSRSRMEDVDGASYEATGIPPHVPVWITDEDRAAGVDTIIETAVAVLLERLGASARGGAATVPSPAPGPR